VETGDYHNSMLLQLEEDAIWKAAHACAVAVPINNRELQWMFRDRLNRGFDRQGETIP
jgi:hypothetical protein